MYFFYAISLMQSVPTNITFGWLLHATGPYCCANDSMVTLCGQAVACSNVTSTGSNVLFNGDAETAGTGWIHWTQQPVVTQLDSFTLTNVFVLNDADSIEQTVTIPSGSRYAVLSGWVRNSQQSGDTFGTLSANMIGGYAASPETRSVDQFETNQTFSNGWSQHLLSFPLVPSATSMTVSLKHVFNRSGTGVNTAYFDNVTIRFYCENQNTTSQSEGTTTMYPTTVYGSGSGSGGGTMGVTTTPNRISVTVGSGTGSGSTNPLGFSLCANPAHLIGSATSGAHTCNTIASLFTSAGFDSTMCWSTFYSSNTSFAAILHLATTNCCGGNPPNPICGTAFDMCTEAVSVSNVVANGDAESGIAGWINATTQQDPTTQSNVFVLADGTTAVNTTQDIPIPQEARYVTITGWILDSVTFTGQANGQGYFHGYQIGGTPVNQGDQWIHSFSIVTQPQGNGWRQVATTSVLVPHALTLRLTLARSIDTTLQSSGNVASFDNITVQFHCSAVLPTPAPTLPTGGANSPVTVAPTGSLAPLSHAPVSIAPTGSLAPISHAPATVAPTGSLAPISHAPVTIAPTGSLAPISHAPATIAPTGSLAPISHAPVTIAPTASLAPISHAPATHGPVTVAPTTLSPANARLRRALGPGQTFAPVTHNPTTVAPTISLAPVSYAPVTAAPTDSHAPLSYAPVTIAPTDSHAPLSHAPVTTAPTDSHAPLSYAPVTIAPTDSHAPLSHAPVTIAPTDSLAPVSHAPVTTAPTASSAPSSATPTDSSQAVQTPPTSAPVSGPTSLAPTLRPEQQTQLQTPLSGPQPLSSMTESEKASLKWNALVAVIARLNRVNAGNGNSITPADATRTSLSASSSRHGRRQNTIYFNAFFSVAKVNQNEANQAAATITSSDALSVSYSRTGGAVAVATATSASARVGTAQPTQQPSSAPTVGGSTGGSTNDGNKVVIILIPTLIVIGVLVAVWWKVCQSRRAEAEITKAEEGAEPVRLQIISDAVAEAKRRQSAAGTGELTTTTGATAAAPPQQRRQAQKKAPDVNVYELADENPITPTSATSGQDGAFLAPDEQTLAECHRTSVV